MFTVYVLYSESADKLYIGQTADLEKRLLSHNELSEDSWTRNYRPWRLIHHEIVPTRSEALKREKQLKGGQGRAWIRTEFLTKK